MVEYTKSSGEVYAQPIFVMMMVQFMSDKSGLKTRSLGLNPSGTAFSQYFHFGSLSLIVVMGPWFKVSSERLEKPGIDPTIPGLQGE